VGDGLLLTLAAILGKFLSGAWGAPLTGPSGAFGGRAYAAAFVRVGCAMIGRGELGFMLIISSRADGLVSDRGYSATIWALMLATLLGPYAYRLSLKLCDCVPDEAPGEARAVTRADGAGGEGHGHELAAVDVKT
jgi:Kef-type K+ transport system membrane component KefB